MAQGTGVQPTSGAAGSAPAGGTVRRILDDRAVGAIYHACYPRPESRSNANRLEVSFVLSRAEPVLIAALLRDLLAKSSGAFGGEAASATRAAIAALAEQYGVEL